jgi:signal transduction histidine kinase
MVCLLSGQLLTIQGETFLFQTIVDITPLKKSEERLMEYQQNLKKLTSELNLVEERERRRIAINLHDHLTQSLAMTKIKLAEIEKKIPSSEIKQNLKEAGKYLDESIRNSRNITYELSPPVLYELGLSEAVEWLMKKIESTNDIKTVFEGKLGEISISNDERILFYRSINELLNNSIKHSGCKTIWVSLWKERDEILASVRDDGKGFIPEKVANKNPAKGGFGLFSIKERLEYLGGSIKISSIIGKGTNITLSLILKSVPLNEVVN